MDGLSKTEQELVALGAALGSNCVPCIEYHVPQARKVGLSDRQIRAAVLAADQVRQVPARKVLAAALAMLPADQAQANAGPGSADCAGPAAAAQAAGPCCA